MAIAFSKIYDALFSDALFEKQIVVACLIASQQVVTEDPATANHDMRLNFARAVLNNPVASARKMLPMLIVTPEIQAKNYTDATILQLVVDSIDAYAPIM